MNSKSLTHTVGVAVLKDILVVMADIDYAGSDNWWMISLYTHGEQMCHTNWLE